MKKFSFPRIIIALIVLALCFAYLIQGLVDLQITKGDTYAASAGNQSLKTLRLTGTRGMITDAESVILAMSEDVFNVTFYREATSTSAQYLVYTRSIIDAIEIVERNGGSIGVEFVIGRNEETGLLEYRFGEGISDSARQSRSSRWRKNHYIAESKYDDPQAAYDLLYDRYQFDILEEEEGLFYDEDTIFKVMAIYNEMQMNAYNSVPVVIAQDVNFATVAEIEGRSMMLEGFDIEVGSKRVYPRGALASQLIGYVGPISSYETYYSDLEPLGYKLTDTIGKDGIESSMESWLTENISSRAGYRVMEKDNNGSLTRQLEYMEPQDGNNVKLTIIASYQQAAERAIEANVQSTRERQETKMAEGNWLETNKEKISSRDWDKYPLNLADTGVLLVLDVDNGNVLAMAQYPTYDLNKLIAGGDDAAEILLDERNVMMNYAIQQRAEPGSVFKMVTSLAALVNGRLSPADLISDEGPYMRYTTNESDAPVCWIAKSARSDHANQTIIQGLSNSCNYFFYELGARLYGDNGSTLLYQYSEELGLTSLTGIDLPGEMRGVVGNQANLYDPGVSLYEQRTWQPRMVANSLKKHLLSVGESNGVLYDNARLDACIKRLMDMAVTTSQNDWILSMRPILMEELNMTRDVVMLASTMNDLYNYLNDIKWGGSMEIQTAIGQGITLVTPAAMSRYIAALANGGVVYNLNIIDSIISPEGEVISKRSANVLNKLEGVAPYLPYIKKGMEGVVDESGTANKYFKNWKYKDDIWAKTGTSQVTIGGIKLDLENNAWFCALTPYEKAEIAVICFVPNGYSGGEASLGARNFIEWWMDEQAKDTGDTGVVAGNELMP